MNTYEALEASLDGIVDVVITDVLPPTMKGYYTNEFGCEIILISDKLNTCAERTCILAEEIGHYETSTGNILNQKDVRNKKQEVRARRHGHRLLLPIKRLIDGFEDYCRNRYELADFLGVTEEYLEEAIEQYRMIHGSYIVYDKYIIYFEPFGVMKLL